METKITSSAVKGVIISLVLIVLGLIIYFAGLSQNKALQWIQSLLYGAGIIWAAVLFSKQSNGNVTFGNVFAHSFITSIIVTVITIIYTFIFIKFIAPTFIDQSIEIARQKLEAKNMTADQIDQALTMTRKYFVVFAIGGSLIMDLILGAIFALIGAAVAKKNPDYQQPLEQQ